MKSRLPFLSARTIAQKSVDLLCEMLDGGPARHVTVGYTLVEGESLARVRTENA